MNGQVSKYASDRLAERLRQPDRELGVAEELLLMALGSADLPAGLLAAFRAYVQDRIAEGLFEAVVNDLCAGALGHRIMTPTTTRKLRHALFRRDDMDGVINIHAAPDIDVFRLVDRVVASKIFLPGMHARLAQLRERYGPAGGLVEYTSALLQEALGPHGAAWVHELRACPEAFINQDHAEQDLLITGQIASFNNNRVVLRFDRSLMQLLCESDVPSPLPTAVLERFPYHGCACILSPSRGDDGTGHQSCIMGMVDHPSLGTSLGILYLASDQDGSADITYMHLPLSSRTLDEAIDSAWRMQIPERARQLGDRDWFRERIPACVMAALYLCSDKPDITGRVPGSGGANRPLPKLTSGDCESRVGYRVGSAYRQQSAPSAVPPGAPCNRRMPTHWRRAHYHLYWTGANRSTPRLNWVAPTLVRPENKDHTAVVVRPVARRERA